MTDFWPQSMQQLMNSWMLAWNFLAPPVRMQTLSVMTAAALTAQELPHMPWSSTLAKEGHLG